MIGRREFITLLGGATVVAVCGSRAATIADVGFLYSGSPAPMAPFVPHFSGRWPTRATSKTRT